MISTREWIIQQGLRRLEQSELDQQWLKSWLEGKRTRTTSSLSDYRQRLCQHAHLLRNYRIALDEKNTENLQRWKREIEESNELIYRADLIREIERKIRQRKSKRARLRRRKEKMIDEPVIIFNPSTTKKSWMEKIDEIRAMLKQIDERRRENPSETIREQLAELERLCAAKIDEYERARAKESDVDLYNHLFNNRTQSFYESEDRRAEEFLRAHRNRSDLVEIRQQWDHFLSPTPTNDSLPFQWHTVTTVGDPTWANFLLPRPH